MTASMFIPQNHKSLFRQLLGGMYDAVLITDPNGHIIQVNPRAIEFFGHSDEELTDRPVSVLIPGVTSPMVQRIRKGLGDNRHIMLDANCQRKDGSMFQAEVTVSVIDLMNPGDLVFTVRNTERRRRQIDVFRSKENCFAMSPAALFVCAPDGRIRQANRAFLDMFGFKEQDEAVKKNFSELMPDAPLPELFANALKGEAGSARVKSESESGVSGELDVQLRPDLHGKRNVGVVGSIISIG